MKRKKMLKILEILKQKLVDIELAGKTNIVDEYNDWMDEIYCNRVHLTIMEFTLIKEWLDK